MLTVMVLRHARAVPERGGGSDHDRALDGEGREQAARVGAYVAERHGPPRLALCSTAARARQTLELASPTWAQGPETVYDPGLYLTGADALLARLAAVPDAVDRVLLVGHNPGVGHLAAELVGTPAAKERIAGFPPGALAVLSAEGPWAALAWGTASLVDLAVP